MTATPSSIRCRRDERAVFGRSTIPLMIYLRGCSAGACYPSRCMALPMPSTLLLLIRVLALPGRALIHATRSRSLISSCFGILRSVVTRALSPWGQSCLAGADLSTSGKRQVYDPLRLRARCPGLSSRGIWRMSVTSTASRRISDAISYHGLCPLSCFLRKLYNTRLKGPNIPYPDGRYYEYGHSLEPPCHLCARD
jgi:hypothetical protein